MSRLAVYIDSLADHACRCDVIKHSKFMWKLWQFDFYNNTDNFSAELEGISVLNIADMTSGWNEHFLYQKWKSHEC